MNRRPLRQKNVRDFPAFFPVFGNGYERRVHSRLAPPPASLSLCTAGAFFSVEPHVTRRAARPGHSLLRNRSTALGCAWSRFSVDEMLGPTVLSLQKR